ncbi:MAG: hypothetical protein FWG68_11220 [Defluviitaleaceae bacterium]|nr:hypothetical protein [Defluviitaleaceae bacterium]
MKPPLKERFAAEMQKIREMAWRERREYIWDYYKLHIIGGLLFIFLGGSILNDTVINPPASSVLTIAWMAGFEMEENLNALSDTIYPIVVDYTQNETLHILNFNMIGDPQHDMAQHTRFSAMTAAQEIDIVIGTFAFNETTEVPNLGIAPAWTFMDLRPVLAEIGVNSDNLLFFEEDDNPPLAFAIPLDETPAFANLGIATENRYLAIVVNTLRYDAVVTALRELWAS